MQVRSSITRTIPHHFSYHLPLHASKPSARPLPPQALGRNGCPPVCRRIPQPRFCHMLLLQILGQERLQSQKKPHLTIHWLVIIDICPCQSNYGSSEILSRTCRVSKAVEGGSSKKWSSIISKIDVVQTAHGRLSISIPCSAGAS